MSSLLETIIRSRIRSAGPITVAEYMELALYHPKHGYYSRAVRRTGRSGDFFTSVDAGPLFGATIAAQLGEMRAILRAAGATDLHLVEAGASDGRLARDILDAARSSDPDLYASLRVTLVERSAAARAAQHEMLAAHAAHVNPPADRLPRHVTGVVLANELLDALPVHLVVRRPGGLRELYVGEREGSLAPVEGPLSSPRVSDELERSGVALPEGVQAEIGVAGVAWIREAAAALSRGFLLLFDYGHPAAELYSATHASGTLVAYHRHTSDRVPWFSHPGRCDLTAHVNLTGVAAAAEAAGLTALGIVDQTYFLLGLGVLDRLESGRDPAAVRRRLEARTLLMPGGLGSTIKAMAFGRDVGTPPLRGFVAGRLT